MEALEGDGSQVCTEGMSMGREIPNTGSHDSISGEGGRSIRNRRNGINGFQNGKAVLFLK
jgi:hypothetical protein